MIIDRSTVRYAGGDDPAGGIQIYTPPLGKVVISNSLISNSSSSGIYCFNSTPTINYCTIKNNNGDGIYCDGIKGYDEDIGNLTIELFFKQGWNLISLPVIPEDNTMDVLFGELPYYSVYSWNITGQFYKKLDENDHMEVGRGYMFDVLNDTLLNISGAPIFNYTVDLTKGWNMIGSLIYDASIADPDDDPNNSVLNWAYAMDLMGNFVGTQDIRPARGYWVMALDNCTLMLDCEKKSPVIEGNTISYNDGDGIFFNSSDSLMENNKIYSNNGNGV
ncbi:right-handed parallel beta-helix repeat-containing protein, partial [bacterium]|nr:right-handed parallel beta-helix repeat-containing protein [bacterium]